MLNVIHALFALFFIGIILGLTITVFWFCYAMLVNFYKIYIKKPEVNKTCHHASAHYTENHPDKVWTCNDCGESVN